MSTNQPTPIGADLIGQHCIVRTNNAGVFAGVLSARDGREAVVTDARRLWYWSGAASLSKLARGFRATTTGDRKMSTNTARGWLAMQHGTTDRAEIYDELAGCTADDVQGYCRHAGMVDEANAIIEAMHDLSLVLSRIRIMTSAYQKAA